MWVGICIRARLRRYVILAGDPHAVLQALPRPQLCCLLPSSMAIVGASAIASLRPSDENAYLADIPSMRNQAAYNLAFSFAKPARDTSTSSSDFPPLKAAMR
jgi:hypothetical protein